MVNKIKQILNDFMGKDVNVATVGDFGGYFCLENFSWRIEDSNNDELLMLEDEHDNKHKYINLDYVDDLNIDNELGQVVFLMSSGNQVQLWVDI